MLIKRWQLRALMGILALRNLGAALTLTLTSDRLEISEPFSMAFSIAPVSAWAIGFTIVGLSAIGGVILPRSSGIRALCTTSVFLGMAMGTSIALSGTTSIALVNFLSFAAVDLVFVSIPLFETWGGSRELED